MNEITEWPSRLRVHIDKQQCRQAAWPTAGRVSMTGILLRGYKC